MFCAYVRACVHRCTACCQRQRCSWCCTLSSPASFPRTSSSMCAPTSPPPFFVYGLFVFVCVYVCARARAYTVTSVPFCCVLRPVCVVCLFVVRVHTHTRNVRVCTHTGDVGALFRVLCLVCLRLIPQPRQNPPSHACRHRRTVCMRAVCTYICARTCVCIVYLSCVYACLCCTRATK